VVGTVEYPLVNPDEMVGEAWAAMQRQDSDEALRLWRALRREFPERPDGYVWPIQVLWQNGRLDEAEVVAAEAFARFPENPDVLVQYGWIATMRQRWDEALRWWAAVRSQAPDRLDGYLWATRALWTSARFDEAEAMASEALARFPGNADLQAERAWIAINRNDWKAALHCWELVLEVEPERRGAQAGVMQALRCLGHAADAEVMASEALARHPEDPDFLAEHIWSAVDRGDWAAAASRLEAARGGLQQAGRFEEIRAAVDARRQTALGGVNSPAPAAQSNVASDEISASELMLSFESLGEKCDFGAVQRHYGVEPLGLLRFSFSPFDPLLAALEDRFEAIGALEDTGFERFRDETILIMKKYGLFFHTFVYEGELPTPEKRDAFREQQRRRLAFLKRKLIADLEEPQKICVYSSDDRTTDDDAARLFAALRAYGPNSLLYVRPSDADHPVGTVETLQEGLYIGYFTRLTDFMAEEQPPFELWRQLCERTYRLVQGGPGR